MSDLLVRPVVAIAGEEDALATYQALRGRLDPETDRPLVVYVVQKAGGAMDKAPMGALEEMAQRAFAGVEELAAEDGVEIDTEIYYGTDVAETIVDAAGEVDATSIVFTSRGGGSWLDLISGGVRSSLITKTDRPVVVLPAPDATDE